MSNNLVNDLKPIHDELHARIKEIDTKLDSLLDPTSAGKSKVINERVEQNKERADKVVTHLAAQLEEASIDEKIGMYYALIRGLDRVYKSTVSEAVDTLVKNMPKPEPLITEAEAKDLSAIRSDFATKVRQLIDMAKTFGDAEGFYEPSKRTGKSGKRGPRALSLYTFAIGDKEYEDLNAVAEDYSQYYPKGSAIAAEMRGDYERPNKKTGVMETVRGTGKRADGTDNPDYIDTTNPPKPGFSFTLKNGDVLVATLKEDEDEGPAPLKEDDSDEDEGPAPDSDEAIYGSGDE